MSSNSLGLKVGNLIVGIESMHASMLFLKTTQHQLKNLAFKTCPFYYILIIFDCCKQSLKELLHPPTCIHPSRTILFAYLNFIFFSMQMFNFSHLFIIFIIQFLHKCSTFPAFFIRLNFFLPYPISSFSLLPLYIGGLM